MPHAPIVARSFDASRKLMLSDRKRYRLVCEPK
jgi:hypothetical protein